MMLILPCCARLFAAPTEISVLTEVQDPLTLVDFLVAKFNDIFQEWLDSLCKLLRKESLLW
jgi:hypothetical protein